MNRMNKKKVGRIFEVLSKETNLRIICALAGKEMCVTSLQLELDLKQANLSQHLNVLKRFDILDCKKEGNRSCYFIKDKRYVKLLKETSKLFTEEVK